MKGGGVLLGFVIACYAVCRLLPAGSLAQTAASGSAFVILEVAVLVLAVLALRRTGEFRGKWVWALVVAWLVLNLLGDTSWGIYQTLKKEVPTPSLADWFYLPSYLVGFGAVLVAAWKTSGRLRTIETMLDAMMFTIGAAALSWPYAFGPLIRVGAPGAAYWVSLSYPVGDLLILFAFASFFLGSQESAERPRPYYVVLCLAFLMRMVADAAYLMINTANRNYEPGNWLDPLWLLAFVLAGLAALMEMQTDQRPAADAVPNHRHVAWLSARAFGSSHWRILIPYVGIPVVAATLLTSLVGAGWKWATDTRVLVYLGFMLVLLLLIRQYVTLTHNRRLNVDLQRTSTELEEKVDDLHDVNARLEVLNSRSHQLNSLREVRSVADAGLELACTFAKSPGGWITLRDERGEESLFATRGQVTIHRPGDTRFNAVEVAKGTLGVVALHARGEELGNLWLVRPDRSSGPDLLSIVAAHISTAIDNTRRYEEALHLAERDPLTGLYNHRGIHKRLAGESLRAQQNGSELSLVMLDMDDFKLLNDTFGHPVGDAVLRHVSDAIRLVLRHADLAGRVGGDELLIVLPNTGAEGALQLSQRLRETLDSRAFTLEDGTAIQVRFSLGVSTYPADGHSLSQLIETADANLYASKQQGGNTVTGCAASSAAEIEAHRILGVAGKLLDVVGARDHYTRKHSEHVALYALSLGEALGLSDESLNTLHIAAMLHDIGKIGVSAELLRRPTALTPAEYDLVHRHVDMGVSVINDMPRLARVAEAVSAHHEHMDGSGYPGEVSGDDIPLLGRILAVADAYSAMTLERPYRKGLSREQARAELMRAAGTQLDPRLVLQFIGLLDRQNAEQAGVRAEAG